MSTRWLLPVAILGIVAGVAGTFYVQKRTQIRRAPAPPRALPAGVDAIAHDWEWSHNIGSSPRVSVTAKDFRQLQNPERTELEGVELRLFHADGRQFDKVTCAHAIFDPAQGTLYSDGEVEITMGMRAEGTHGRLVYIRTSGVTFDAKTGRASTDRPATFTFDQGHGSAAGASYDPSTRELVMRSEARIEWRGRGPKSRPMTLEAGELVYKEAHGVVMLSPWSRLVRANATLEAADAVVTLQDGAIRTVEARQARGADRYADRQLEYSADQLWLEFARNGEVEKIIGEGRARLVSTSATARTTVTTNRLQLDFEPGRDESTLKKAYAMGNSRLEWAPLAGGPAAMAETRVLRSEVIELAMRPGGREIERMETHSPGRLEFLPNHPGHRHRVLNAERLWISYGLGNQMQSFRAVSVMTRTDPEPRHPGQTSSPVETWSNDLSAEFEPKTSRLTRLEQWNNFRYQEGARKARAERAVLDEARRQITLENGARVWDESGSTAADRILLDQSSGDMTAQGRVVSSRLPDRKGKGSAMLSNEESVEAKAERMSTAERNQRIVYEGSVVMWQGANRLQADRVEIDRRARRLTAEGNVVTQFLDRPKQQTATGNGAVRRAPAFVVIRASQLIYTEQDRLAHYRGGVRLSRPGMEVGAAEIRAYLNEAGSDSALDRAFADGQVEIVHTQPGRTRKGTAEHAEYYVAQEKVVLRGGEPALEDSVRGQTRGQELTWFARDDRLLVYGLDNRPVKSRLRRN